MNAPEIYTTFTCQQFSSPTKTKSAAPGLVSPSSVESHTRSFSQRNRRKTRIESWISSYLVKKADNRPTVRPSVSRSRNRVWISCAEVEARPLSRNKRLTPISLAATVCKWFFGKDPWKNHNVRFCLHYPFQTLVGAFLVQYDRCTSPAWDKCCLFN